MPEASFIEAHQSLSLCWFVLANLVFILNYIIFFKKTSGVSLYGYVEAFESGCNAAFVIIWPAL